MFRISELTDKKTLTCVTYTIFQERDLIKTFKIPGKVFLNFLRTLEDHYLQVSAASINSPLVKRRLSGRCFCGQYIASDL